MKVYLGIDWSERKHDVCMINECGEVIQQLVIEHSPEGFLALDMARRKMEIEARECVVGLETAHNLLVDFLWDQGYEQVYVLPPNAVKSAQGRYRQSGAKNDASDCPADCRYAAHRPGTLHSLGFRIWLSPARCAPRSAW